MEGTHKCSWNRPAKRVIPPCCVPKPEGESVESGTLGLVPKSGDILLPRLNIDGKPIANKYCEGKVKRTLKRGSKDLKPLRRKQWGLAKADDA